MISPSKDLDVLTAYLGEKITPDKPMKYLAILIVLSGISLHYYLYRRQFNRKNMVGREMFTSYEQKVSIRFLDWILNVVGSGLVVAAFYTCFFI